MTTRAEMSESAEHEGGHTELMRALEGRTETVKTLLESRADVNEKDHEGRTALMFAVTNIQTASVNLLLAHDADVNATAKDGCTALMLAASSGDTEIVRVLLSKGAYVTGKFTANGKTALMLRLCNARRLVCFALVVPFQRMILSGSLFNSRPPQSSAGRNHLDPAIVRSEITGISKNTCHTDFFQSF